jgi:hypothetical protein
VSFRLHLDGACGSATGSQDNLKWFWRDDIRDANASVYGFEDSLSELRADFANVLPSEI